MYNISINGATGTAFKRVIPALKDSPICTVSAIQGRNMDVLKEIQKKFNIAEVYIDSKEMLKKANYDCIYIATPPFLHLGEISNAVKTYKPIICEKPLARNYLEGIQISELIRAYKKYF